MKGGMKMNLKEFFVITKGKIILSIILLILFLFYAFLVYSNIYLHDYSPSILYDLIFWPILTISSVLSLITLANADSFFKTLLIILTLFLEVLYIYILSSIVIWMFNKLRRKNK